MAEHNNLYSDISSIVQDIQEDAMFVAHEASFMQALVTPFDNKTGMAARKNYIYTEGSFNQVGEGDDLVSQAFTPSVSQTLTPYEYGLQYFLSDQRIESDPFALMSDAAQSIGFGLSDKVNGHLCGDFSSFTGGTIGTAGGTLTPAKLSAAIAICRNAVKNKSIPLNMVLHDYQWQPISAAVMAGGATYSPQFIDEATRNYYVASFGNVNIYTTSFISVDASDDAIGAVFPRQALAIDWRRALRNEPDRKPSRRGWELNATSVYAHGVWRPEWGVQLVGDASTPS